MHIIKWYISDRLRRNYFLKTLWLTLKIIYITEYTCEDDGGFKYCIFSG